LAETLVDKVEGADIKLRSLLKAFYQTIKKLHYEIDIFYRIRIFKENSDGMKVEVTDDSELIEANYLYTNEELEANRRKIFPVEQCGIASQIVRKKILSD